MQKHQHGGDIYSGDVRIDFSANINPLGTPESVIRAAQESIRESAHYPDVECRRLRMSLAEKEQVSTEQIICGNGAAELIFAAVQAQAPKKALLAAPGFAEYEQALRITGCEIYDYALKKENGFRVQRDILQCLTEEIDMMFLCNPNNPTGVLVERELLLDIIKVCREKQIRIVLDSCFLDFLDDREAADCTCLLSEYPNLFILKAFTKIYAMAGLRLGYGLCADTAFLERMKEMVQPWSVSIPAQAAGVAALTETAYVERARALVKEERQWLKKELVTLGLTVYDSQANYIFFEGPAGLPEKCRAQGILIRDCSNYRGLTEGYYRVAVRTREENAELIHTLEKILEE